MSIFKRIILLAVFIQNLNFVVAFENKFYGDLGMGFNFEDPVSYTQLPYLNIDWNGVFKNGLGLILGINYQHLSGSVRFYPDNKLPNNRLENINLIKYSIGQSFGKNFNIYIKQNFMQFDDVYGFSLSTGHRGGGLFGSSNIGLGYFVNLDFPIKLFNEKEIVYPSDISFSIGISFIYSVGRKKAITRARQLEIEQAEERQRIEAEQKKQAHEAMLKEKGLTEEEWQAQEEEKRRQEELRRRQERQEQESLSKLIQNIIDVGFNIGEPFRVGEIVTIPYGLFSAIDYSYYNNVHSYLVIMNDYSTPSKPFYIESERQLNSIGPLRIQYIGSAQYLDGRVPRNTLRFKEIR
jgi:hypothetical protein